MVFLFRRRSCCLFCSQPSVMEKDQGLGLQRPEQADSKALALRSAIGNGLVPFRSTFNLRESGQLAAELKIERIVLTRTCRNQELAMSI
jgi:hypothetical protein